MITPNLFFPILAMLIVVILVLIVMLFITNRKLYRESNEVQVLRNIVITLHNVYAQTSLAPEADEFSYEDTNTLLTYLDSVFVDMYQRHNIQTNNQTNNQE